MKKRKILLTGAFKYAKEQLEAIAELGFEVEYIQDERVKLPESYFAVDSVVGNQIFLYNDIAKFKNLRYIQLSSVGTDRVPIAYIKEHKITLKTAGDVYSIPMAEWVIGKILELYKHSYEFFKAQQKQAWIKDRNIVELSGKKAAIIGFGNVGREIAKRLKPFNVQILAVSPRANNADYFDAYYPVAEIEAALQESDIVILTLPLNADTKHLFNDERFAAMKSGGIFINVSRGGIVDETALSNALNSGKISGAALDVFETEPLPQDSPLWHRDNLIITPHNAFVSENNAERLFRLIYENLKEEIAGTEG
ncbi:MAG: NAD(P)-binding domain-containing protein [Oscillospiraceae bacterium]|nr:NAD(P)-binding domain-containing protein [Oscillospiraceae bacterium]